MDDFFYPLVSGNRRRRAGDVRAFWGGRGLPVGGGPPGRKGGGPTYILQPPDGQQIDPASSTVVVSGASVVSGSTRTVTVTTKNSIGSTVIVTGLTVVVSKAGGTATGTLSSVTDNGNGTYTCTYTGVLAGTAQTISATLNGVSVTGGSVQSIAVTPGAIDRTTSTYVVSASTGPQGGSALTGTLTAKDAAGNSLTAGGSTVVFSQSGGTAVLTISGTTDVGNGTYTCTLGLTTQGTATTINATIGGQAVTTTAPTVTVTAPAASSDFTQGPQSGDVTLMDDYMDTDANIADREARAAALAAGVVEFFLYRAQVDTQGTVPTIESGGIDGRTRHMRLVANKTGIDPVQPNYDATVAHGHHADSNNPFGPNDNTLVLEIWQEMSDTLVGGQGMKGVCLGHANDRTQYGIIRDTHSLGFMNNNAQSGSTAHIMYPHIENGAADAPVKFRRWNGTLPSGNVGIPGAIRHWIFVWKRNTTQDVTSVGLEQVFIDGEKIIDVSTNGLATGWMVARSGSGDQTGGNVGEKYAPIGVPIEALRHVASQVVNAISYPLICLFEGQGAANQTFTIDIYRMRLWRRPP